MKSGIRILAILALLGSLAILFLAFDIQTNGALDSGGVERYPSANQVGQLLSGIALVGEVALLVGTVLSAI